VGFHSITLNYIVGPPTPWLVKWVTIIPIFWTALLLDYFANTEMKLHQCFEFEMPFITFIGVVVSMLSIGGKVSKIWFCYLVIIRV
jgi:hypothetical protein